MVAPDDSDPQVILVVEEADLVSDFQQHFASRGVTVRFAEDPGAARQAIEDFLFDHRFAAVDCEYLFCHR